MTQLDHIVIAAESLQQGVDYLREALGVWQRPALWSRLVKNGMARDFSWERQGPRYETLYESLIASTR